jgi:DNA-binding Lrp family transcriptional regulator
VVPDADDAIVAMLVQDARVTHRRIAEVTGLSESTVRSRVQRIIASGRVSTTVLAHPGVEGGRFAYLLRLRLRRGQDPAALIARQEFAAAPWAARAIRRSEVLVQFSATDFDEMVAGMDRIRALPEVERVTSTIVLRVSVGASWDTEGDGVRWARQPTRGVDETDREIIAVLRRDGRTSYTDLAAVAGLTVAATRRRVLRLVEDGLIRFATRVNDEDFATHEASVDLSVATSETAELIRDLCAMRTVRYTIEQSGPYSVAAYVVARDPDELEAALASITTDPRVLDSRTEQFRVLQDQISWFGGVS